MTPIRIGISGTQQKRMNPVFHERNEKTAKSVIAEIIE